MNDYRLNENWLDGKARQAMIDNGFEPVGGPPEKAGEKIRSEIAKWAPVVKAAGIKVD